MSRRLTLLPPSSLLCSWDRAWYGSARRPSHRQRSQRPKRRRENLEIFVSASSESYNGTDWNNDGDIGSSSDQFIELWNAGPFPVDVSDWLLDDITDGVQHRVDWLGTPRSNPTTTSSSSVRAPALNSIIGTATPPPSPTAGQHRGHPFLPRGGLLVGHILRQSQPTGRSQNRRLPHPVGAALKTTPTAQNMVRCYGLNDNVHTVPTSSRVASCP